MKRIRMLVVILGIMVFSILGMSLASFGENQWVSIGPEGITVTAIAINPHAPETLYIGTDFFGIFKSIDGGANWAATSSGLSNLDVGTLAINPQTPETLYAGTSEGGVFRSIDGGENWVSVNTGLPSFSSLCVDALAINPLIPGTIYVGTCFPADGAFKSIDGGLTWTPIDTGLPVPSSPASLGLSALAINPQTPDILYGGTVVFPGMDLPGYCPGLFKSTNGGTTWIASTLSQICVSCLAIDPQTPETIYAGTPTAGVFKTIDGGMMWNTVNVGLIDLSVYALVVNHQTPETLYVGTKGGVFRSIDGGMTWGTLNAGLPASTLEALAINPQTPEILYAGTKDFGLFKTKVGASPSILTVSKAGTGSGTVTSSPAGINCGTTCSGSYDPGTVVTLTVAPESGSTFAGWSWACAGTGTCSVTMDSDKTATAIFNLQQQSQYSLIIIKSGTGSGTVTSSPAGISCGTNCSETYSRAQKVRLRTRAEAGSTFIGWSGGGCSGTGICEVNVDSPTVITAGFMKKLSQISVTSTSLSFGGVEAGRSAKRKLSITNNGTGDLSLVAGGLEGTDFSIGGKTSVTVRPNRTISLSVVFRPTSPGPQVTLLKISSNDLDKLLIDIPLSGTSGPGR